MPLYTPCRQLVARKVACIRKNRESYFLPFKRESSCRRSCSPPRNAKAEKNPTSPASRGAEAIPAQRERRSRRAYHPQRGKMRADCPLRRAADRVYDMR